jgi:hypothetical protein
MPEKKALKPGEVICRQCGCGPYVPDFKNDFYVDDVDGPGTGLCEKCFLHNALAPKDPVIIEGIHVEDVCRKSGGAAVCRFLVLSDGFKCAKGSRLEEYIQSRLKTMGAKGDNCSGPPEFKPN